MKEEQSEYGIQPQVAETRVLHCVCGHTMKAHRTQDTGCRYCWCRTFQEEETE